MKPVPLVNADGASAYENTPLVYATGLVTEPTRSSGMIVYPLFGGGAGASARVVRGTTSVASVSAHCTSCGTDSPGSMYTMRWAASFTGYGIGNEPSETS